MPPSPRFVTLREVAHRFEGKSVAIVGSGPSSLDNDPGFIDSHDIVVRVNNYKTAGYERSVGSRTDVFYSFFGTSIKKAREDLIRDGVALCMCKCPNGKPIESEWHERNGKQVGVDFRYIYRRRQGWWFCDTYIPTAEHFLSHVAVLNGHIPTTGFSCVLDVAAFDCASIYLTGFDFFASGVHNVDEVWRPGAADDPLRHRPDLELAWVKNNAHRMKLDKRLRESLSV